MLNVYLTEEPKKISYSYSFLKNLDLTTSFCVVSCALEALIDSVTNLAPMYTLSGVLFLSVVKCLVLEHSCLLDHCT